MTDTVIIATDEVPKRFCRDCGTDVPVALFRTPGRRLCIKHQRERARLRAKALPRREHTIRTVWSRAHRDVHDFFGRYFFFLFKMPSVANPRIAPFVLGN